MSNKYVVVDLETTGHSPKKGDKIIQFAAVVVENGEITDTYSSLVNPGQPIPAFIEELTGLNDQMVKNAPTFSEIAPRIHSLLEGAYFVAHNVLFDLSFLQEELIMAGFEGFYGSVIDTVELSRFLIPTADSYKLGDLAIREGLNHDRPHQADSDSYVTAELLIILLDRLKQLPIVTLHQLLKLSGGLKSDIEQIIEEYIQIKETKIEDLPFDLEVYRGIALKKRKDKGKPISLEKPQYPLSDEDKEQLFQRAFPSFEKRLGQFRMMDTIFQSFQKNEHALIEAGTGVGKSIAYLLPAALFSKEKGEPVVISTYTTQLQEQLLEKDIPLLEGMLSSPLTVVLLKGRQHYISLARFEQSLKDDDDNYDTTLTKMQILVWLTETETGDYDEINLSSGGAIYWDKIKNDESIFMQNKSWFSRDFYLNSKKAAGNADMIITNHSLLLSDLVSEHPILPEYQYVIIDEGHHFEKAAGKYFGLSFDYLSTRLLLNRLGTMEQRQLLYKLDNLLSIQGNEHLPSPLHSFEVNEIMQELHLEMDDFFRILAMTVKIKVKSSTSTRMSYRLRDSDSSKEWKAALNSAERFSFLLKDLIGDTEKKLQIMKKNEHKLKGGDRAFLEEISSLVQKMKEMREGLKETVLRKNPEYVNWIELDTRSPQNMATLYTQPVTISGLLKERFFDQKKSAIITSATLTVKNSFSFILKELGLKDSKVHLAQIPSHFPYEEQVQLVVPNDLPEIKSVTLDEYVAAISEHIISIAEASKGRMLILFTSYDMLRKTYNLVKESGLLDEFILIAQGITGGSRTRMTRNFRRFDKAILFGTSSFWEGIDLPGEDLSCLVIVRLPFSPPDEPITEAKCELIKKNGGNPFYEYSLPEAVLRFKQGFGRLIRTNQDRGFIVIFDRRVVTTTYGKAFLQSIPSIPVLKQSIDETVQLIHAWLP
ncbi:ATP-dependent DNA helicase DinG [Bacillus massilinigeriensis]|uniref:ATP-dependent DNA helicase DinG n=1 Tax=Bacillus massilionigeriensis TaxID=1805475 RepID=UPI00096AF7B1|nr:ATP-dependent DNA helicase DinG [Bacillus massilionigeriensis]